MAGMEQGWLVGFIGQTSLSSTLRSATNLMPKGHLYLYMPIPLYPFVEVFAPLGFHRESRRPYAQMVTNLKQGLTDGETSSIVDKRAPVTEGYKMGGSNQGECAWLLTRMEAGSIPARPATLGVVCC